jgi:hypothetical protein
MDQFKIRGCSGLGDAFYTYVVAKHYAEVEKKNVLLETNYPDVFSTLRISTTSARIFDPQIYCTYVPFKQDHTTNQFQDVLRAAKIEAPLRLKHPHPKKSYFETKAGRHIMSSREHQYKKKYGWPVCVIADPYLASGVRNRETLKPDKKTYSEIVNLLNKKYFTVLSGKGPIEETGADCSIKGMTDVADLIAVVASADLVLTQVGALLPMAEALRTPVVSILSANYRKTGDPFLNTINPGKVVCGDNSHCFWDDQKDLIERIGLCT